MQDEKNYQSTVVERNLGDVIWAVLTRWKLLLVVALLAGLIFGGYSFYNGNKALKDPKKIAEQQEEYQQAKDSYDNSKANLERKLTNLQKEQDKLDTLSNTAIMLQVDQFNVYSRSGSYYINTNYEVSPHLFYQNPDYTTVITKSYQAAITRVDLDGIISQGRDSRLTTRNPVSGNSLTLLSTSMDSPNGYLRYTVYGDTQERVDLVAEAIKQVLKEQEVLLNQVIGEHTLDLLIEDNQTVINTEFGELQTAFTNQMEKVSDEIKSTTDKLSKLRAPVNQTPSVKKILVGAVKKTVIGIVGGLLGMFVLLGMAVVLRDRVFSTDELRERYHAPVLGSYSNGKKPGIILCFLYKKLGLSHLTSPEEAVKLIAANTRYYLNGADRLMLVGTGDEKVTEELQKRLVPLLEGVQIQRCGNVNENPAAVDALSENAALICVERVGKSAHRDVMREVQTIRAAGERELAFILTL